MADTDQKLSPFERAAREAEAARVAAAGKAAPSAGGRAGAPASGAAPRAAGRAAFGPAGQTAAREPFLASDSAQFLKAQQARMERARLDAERQRLRLAAERLKSHLFIKKQEVARVATRLRAAESSLVAAESEARRAHASLGASAGAIHERSNARGHLATEREATDRDYERRELAEQKAIDAIERDMEKLARHDARSTPQYADLDRRRRDRQRGLASIQRERSRRRIENGTKDAALARQLAGAERSEQTARRAADLAERLVEKYRQQVRAFGVAKQALDEDYGRMERELAQAEAASRRAGVQGPHDVFGGESTLQ